jgi:hypothetical protein
MNQIIKEKKVRSSGPPKQQVPCESALRKQGVDEGFIAERLVNLFEAKGRRWNTATKSWETFEDYETQLAAIKEAAKLLGLYPTLKELEARHRPHEVVISVVHETTTPQPQTSRSTIL